MRWYFNGAKVVLKLGATCPIQVVFAMALQDTCLRISERKSPWKHNSQKKSKLRANTPCLKSLLAYAYTLQCAACIT